MRNLFPQAQPPKTAQEVAPEGDFGKVYTFRLRQHRAGDFNMGKGFSGLWELCMLDEKGRVVKTIADADGLQYCLENLSGELENDGF